LLAFLKELYSGSKDCNILAWIPALREPVPDDISEMVMNFWVWTMPFTTVVPGGPGKWKWSMK